MPIKHSGAFLLLSLGLGATAPTTAFSNDAGSHDVGTYDLAEIVVTASRRAENAFLMPYMINVRGMEELQIVRQVRTIPDALRDLPGVMIQKTGHGQGSPFIRGFTGLRTLFLIDGIRLNNSTFREGPNQYWNTVDPLSTYRLELVKGPTSVLYGSDAIGGTVNAISRSYRDVSLASGVQWRLYARAATAESSAVLRPEVGYKGRRFDVIAAVSLKDFGDLEAGHDLGTQPKTGYDEQDAELKFHYNLTANQRVTAAIQHVDQDDAWRVHKTIFGKSWRGTTVGDELRRSLSQQRTLSYLQYRGVDVTPWLDELALSLSVHDQDETRHRTRADQRTDIQGTDVQTTGFFGHLVMPSAAGTFTAGAEFYHDEVESFRSDYNADGTLRGVRIQGPVADDATYQTAAVFLQNQIAYGERTDLTLGFRYTQSEADAKGVEDPLTGGRIRVKDDWSAATLSARFNHRLHTSGGTALFGGVSQGFRAPNLSDLTRFDTARSNEIETPVSTLDSEEFITYEFGIKHAGARWNSQAAVYYTTIDDMVIRTPTGRIIDGDTEITKKNSGNGFVKGIEVQARYQLSDAWSVFGNASWMDGEVDTFPTSDPVLVREPIDRLMTLSANGGFRWHPEDGAWWAEGQVGFADEQDRLSTRDRSDTDRIPPGGTPAYTVLTLRGGWHLSNELSVSAAIENLFDKNYRVHGSGVNEPGTNLIISLLWTSQ
ncbi:MAG: TonB-dependent receptor [Gammaproteobacteria bacterium]|nr:TonB-dependent receptor [Gammaproteobacteria bacterium]